MYLRVLVMDNVSGQRARGRQFQWMDKGFDLGKVLVKKRAGIYDRI